MTFNEYQKLSKRTAKYGPIGHRVIYPTLGLTGEAGEVAEKIKKVMRDEGGIFTEAHRTELSKELGDVLWYIAQIASELELNMEEIARANLDKLMSRLERDKLAGNGDNR